jgi:hypothetical protein
MDRLRNATENLTGTLSGVMAEIRTEHLSNTNLEGYPCANLLSFFMAWRLKTHKENFACCILTYAGRD